MNFLVVSTDALHTDAIVGYLSQSNKVCCTQTTTSYLEACHLCQNHKPEIIILDYEMLAMAQAHWIYTLRQIPMMETASFITLVADIRPAELARIIANHASAILHVHESREYFQNKLFEETRMPLYLSPRIKATIGLIPPNGNPLYTLSKTELQIAALLTQGLNNKEIANELFRSPLTIEDHRKSIKEKLCLTGGKSALLTYLIPYTQWLVEIHKNPCF